MDGFFVSPQIVIALDWQVEMTAPMSRPPVSDLFQMFGQLLEAGQIMHGQKIIHKRQCRLNTLRKGLIASCTQQRIEPDQAATIEVQTLHLATQQIQVTPVPAVADDENCRAMTHHPLYRVNPA